MRCLDGNQYELEPENCRYFKRHSIAVLLSWLRNRIKNKQDPYLIMFSTLRLLIVIVGIVLIVLILALPGQADNIVEALRRWPILP